MDDLVSIILPVYNGARYLDDALNSIAQQTHKNFELIAIDDGSEDESAEILKSFRNLIYIFQHNKGVTVARNRGIKESKGNFIAFLDQDDMWRENALRTHVSLHMKDDKLGYTIAHQVCFMDNMEDTPSWFKLQKLDKPHIGYLPGTLMVKKKIFDRFGLFDPNFSISSDTDWFSRAKDEDIPHHIFEEILLDRRIHEENQSRHSKVIQKELFRILKASIAKKRQKK